MDNGINILIYHNRTEGSLDNLLSQLAINGHKTFITSTLCNASTLIQGKLDINIDIAIIIDNPASIKILSEPALSRWAIIEEYFYFNPSIPQKIKTNTRNKIFKFWPVLKISGDLNSEKTIKKIISDIYGVLNLGLFY